MQNADLKKALVSLAHPEKVATSSNFFKDKSDTFIGVTVPDCRIVAKQFFNLSFPEIKELLKSKVHEERLVGLMILVEQFEKGDEKVRQEIYHFYLANTEHVNNWDLVDLSSYKIVGKFLLDKPRGLLYILAKSNDIWERRIAIVSTMTFIRKGELEDTFKISEMLLHDKEDLIHKAVGWLLREAGKKDETKLVQFLRAHHSQMPRTTLRYAIERFPEETRRLYLKGHFEQG